MYPEIKFYIDGEFSTGTAAYADVYNPATGEPIGKVPHATTQDLDRALAAAERGFAVWRKTMAQDRVAILRRAASLMRERADTIARLITLEQGKTLQEARGEALFAPEHVEWCADEARRIYGRVIPPRAPNVRQIVTHEPVGPVVGFSPWNFPVNQMIRKIAGALSAGCSLIIKAPEETPASCMETVRCFHDAGVPAGVLNLVFGDPAQISEYLIQSPIIRKVSFTGSVPVGRRLAALAGSNMKRQTMELGGHAPVIIFDDVDPEWVAALMTSVKFRNAGQTCISPTRFYVHEAIHDRFVSKFASAVAKIRVGDGLDPDTQMGPLANERRVAAMDRFVRDAVERGAKIEAGGRRPNLPGYFFDPTVLTNVPDDALIMNEEPFGPVVPVVKFRGYDEVVARANRLPFGLAAFAFSRSLERATAVSEDLEAGMVSINGALLNSPETPFGGIKDSGYGFEGGIEGVASYTNVRLVCESRVGGRTSELAAYR